MSNNILEKILKEYNLYEEYSNNINKKILLNNNVLNIHIGEIQYLQGINEIKDVDINLLYLLSPYLSQNDNIIKHNNKIVNQNTLIDLIGMGRKTLYRKLSILEKYKAILKIKQGNECFYMVNPYLITKGRNTNIVLYKIFDYIGYKDKVSYQVYNDNKTLIANDGTVCKSYKECIIHNYLIGLQDNFNFIFEKEIMYKDFINNMLLQEVSGLLRCDWIITVHNKRYIIEYFGMMENSDYVKTHDKKIEIIKLDNQLDNLIPIYEEDLLQLDDKFSFIFSF